MTAIKRLLLMRFVSGPYRESEYYFVFFCLCKEVEELRGERLLDRSRSNFEISFAGWYWR